MLVYPPIYPPYHVRHYIIYSANPLPHTLPSALLIPFIILLFPYQTARTHALTASATAIFNHKTQRAKALLEAATVQAKAKTKTTKPSSSSPSLSSWGSLLPNSTTLSNMNNWLSSAYHNATTIIPKNNNTTAKTPTLPSLWQSLFSSPSPGPKANKPLPSPANRPTLWSYLTRLATWILTPIRSIMSSLSQRFNHMLQYIKQTVRSIGVMLAKIPRNVASLVLWVMSGPQKMVSGMMWLWGIVMTRMVQIVQLVYRLMGVKEMYAMLLTVPGYVMKGRW